MLHQNSQLHHYLIPSLCQRKIHFPRYNQMPRMLAENAEHTSDKVLNLWKRSRSRQSYSDRQAAEKDRLQRLLPFLYESQPPLSVMFERMNPHTMKAG